MRLPPSGRAGLLGMCWAGIPCGLLQSALLVAALASGPAQGAAVMSTFALASGVGLWAGPYLWSRLGTAPGDERWTRLTARLAGALAGRFIRLRALARPRRRHRADLRHAGLRRDGSGRRLDRRSRHYRRLLARRIERRGDEDHDRAREREPSRQVFAEWIESSCGSPLVMSSAGLRRCRDRADRRLDRRSSAARRRGAAAPSGRRTHGRRKPSSCAPLLGVACGEGALDADLGRAFP